MATTKSKADQAKPAPEPRKESEQLTSQDFTRAYAEWVQKQQETALNYQRQCTEAYLELTGNLHEISAAAQRPVLEAQHRLFAAGTTATLSQEHWQNYQQLQQELARVIVESNNDTSHQDKVQKAYQTYAEATQRALEEANRRNTQAYQRYLKVVKDAWSSIDPENLDPANARVLEWSTQVAFKAMAS